MMPRRRPRRHPLAAMVVWLGLSLVVALILLVLLIVQMPSEQDLDAIYMQGMAQGALLCREGR